MTHRRDIDGLRAVAVGIVVLFHARMPWMSGGFVGVDVFFVISGYLITRLILDDLDAGRFSTVQFYERRIRRIFPALFAVLIVSAVAAHWALFPGDLVPYGSSLVATLFFSSNVYFWQRSDYFAAAAETKPLLHTWSLAVEEQFYVVYPLALWLIYRYGRKQYAAILGAILVVSLLLSIRAATTTPLGGFYLAPTRAWELLTGALLVVCAIPPASRGVAALLGLAGLGLVAYSVVAFSASTRFPGAAAVLPVAGAALVIHSGRTPESLVRRFLSAAPLVGIGLVSYSLYLWHWVLFAFVRYTAIGTVTATQTVLTIVASLLFAIVSWRWIERPFRGRDGIGSRSMVFAAAAVVVAMVATYGAATHAALGFPGRFDPEILRISTSRTDRWSRLTECEGKSCHVGPERPPLFVFWGDSHAGALAPVLESLSSELGASGFVATSISCPPLVGMRRFDGSRERCRQFNDRVLRQIDESHIPTIWLHARWVIYAEASRYKSEEGPPPALTASRDAGENLNVFRTLLNTTLDALQGRHLSVVIIAGVPEVGFEVPRALAFWALRKSGQNGAPTLSEFMTRQRRVMEVLTTAAREHSVPIVFPHELLCRNETCDIIQDGRPLYLDSNHLSIAGARVVAPALRELVIAARPNPTP